MPKFLDVTDVSAAKAAINADYFVNAKDFGAVGDGSTDDTDALQEWLDYVVDNQLQGWLPTGTYKITETLVAAGAHYGWGIHGENENFATISQHTDNIPVLQLGSTAGFSHSVRLSGLKLSYNSAQPSTNTDANCILFTGKKTGDLSSLFWSSFRHLQFSNGYYAMSVDSGSWGPWGSEFDMLTMAVMSGGFFNDSPSANSGVPNNRYGRMTLYCDTSVGPIFKDMRGYNCVIGNIEFLRAYQGPQLFTARAAFSADIGSMKLEVGTYTGAGTTLFNFTSPASHVRIGSLHVDGGLTTFTPSSGQLTILANTGNSTIDNQSSIEVGSIVAAGETMSGTTMVFSGASSRCTIHNVRLTDGWQLQNTGNSATGNFVTVSKWVNHTATKRGDDDYTVALGDPNVVNFNTTFTAQRTITLPSKSSNNLCAGLYYDLIFSGAINGANTAVIKEGSNTLRTQSTDNVRLRYMWQRAVSGGEWTLVDVADFDDQPAATVVEKFTTSGTWTKPDGAVSVRVRCIGPGGGGGAGARGPSGTALSGGGGGSSGGLSEMTFDADDLTATVAVTVGAGGSGAAGQTSDDTAGANGTQGIANTSFGSYISAGRGAGGGGGGLAVAGSGGGIQTSGWGYGMSEGAAGGAGSATGAAGTGGSRTGGSAGGGGGGGGITAAASATAGGVGGLTQSSPLAAGTAGSAANGGDGASSAVAGPGTGGGGGGGNAAGAGYDGGDGGDYGAGGGGGGASLNGSASGGGGDGGDGICIVTTYF